MNVALQPQKISVIAAMIIVISSIFFATLVLQIPRISPARIRLPLYAILKQSSKRMELRQVALPVSDLNRAVDFYSRFLNQEPHASFQSAKLAFFQLGKVRLLLDGNLKSAGTSTQDLHHQPSGLIYLNVDDLHDAINRLKLNGARIVSEPHIVFPDPTGIFDQPGNEWLAFFIDSEGNQVGLMSRESIAIH